MTTPIWPPLRNALEGRTLHEVHECAVVLSLDAGLRGHVETQRHQFGSEALVARQLDPHITVLYCGFQDPAMLQVISDLAAPFHDCEIDFNVLGVESFFNRAGLLTNIHYQIESAGLRTLHEELLHAYLTAFRKAQTPYVGSLYTPHISIFDRVAMPKTAVSLFAVPEASGHRAGGLHLVGEPRRP